MPDEQVGEAEHVREEGGSIQPALAVGIGPMGRQIASQLEIMGLDVCLVDLSPINLYAFAQQGFHVVSSDAVQERSP